MSVASTQVFDLILLARVEQVKALFFNGLLHQKTTAQSKSLKPAKIVYGRFLVNGDLYRIYYFYSALSSTFSPLSACLSYNRLNVILVERARLNKRVTIEHKNILLNDVSAIIPPVMAL